METYFNILFSKVITGKHNILLQTVLGLTNTKNARCKALEMHSLHTVEYLL